jgi:hypothetical protein
MPKCKSIVTKSITTPAKVPIDTTASEWVKPLFKNRNQIGITSRLKIKGKNQGITHVIRHLNKNYRLSFVHTGGKSKTFFLSKNSVKQLGSSFAQPPDDTTLYQNGNPLYNNPNVELILDKVKELLFDDIVPTIVPSVPVNLHKPKMITRFGKVKPKKVHRNTAQVTRYYPYQRLRFLKTLTIPPCSKLNNTPVGENAVDGNIIFPFQFLQHLTQPITKLTVAVNRQLQLKYHPDKNGGDHVTFDAFQNSFKWITAINDADIFWNDLYGLCLNLVDHKVSYDVFMNDLYKLVMKRDNYM